MHHSTFQLVAVSIHPGRGVISMFVHILAGNKSFITLTSFFFWHIFLFWNNSFICSLFSFSSYVNAIDAFALENAATD